MISGRIGDAFATLAVICVLSIFLFPAMQGPYSAVHGPASALLAMRAAAKVRSAIAQAASRSLGALTSALTVLCQVIAAETGLCIFTVADRSAVLRC
ncbi:MAG: hypothetical protein ABSG02_17660 [Terriglobales bacterium]|jgi:hypothetical protein